MTETLYHRDIRLPADFVKPSGRVPLFWTTHARTAANSDRYGNVPVQPTMTLQWYDVIEVGMRDGKVSKILFRGGMTKDLDVCIVLVPGDVWKVKTVWIQERNDSHKTLDRSKYVS